MKKPTHAERQAHLMLLADAYYNELVFDDSCETGTPCLSDKRPFGNSNVGADVCEIIELEPEDQEGGYKVWSREQTDYALELYTNHLTPFLKEQWRVYQSMLP